MADDIVIAVTISAATIAITIIATVWITNWAKKSTDRLIVATKESTDQLIIAQTKCLSEDQLKTSTHACTILIEAIKADGEATRKAIFESHRSIKGELAGKQ